MSATIGRLVLNVDPLIVSRDGDVLTVAGWLLPLVDGDTLEVRARLQQLLGLANNQDEEVVPCTFSVDSSRDGFYRVLSAAADGQRMLEPAGVIPYTIQLERLPGFSYPQFEVTVQSTVRTNAHSVTAPLTNPIVGFLTGLESMDTGDIAGFSGLTRTVDDGTALAYSLIAAPMSLKSYRYSIPPASFYSGTCKIERWDGTNWWPVVGRNIPLTNVWRIGNGYIRMTSANGATSGKLGIWDNGAAAYEEQNIKHAQLTPAGIGIGNGTTQAYMTVLRNSPEAVVVRSTGPVTAGSDVFISMTYALLRGHGHVAVSWVSRDNNQTAGAAFNSATPMTLSAGGYALYQTTAVSGNVIVFAIPQAVTTDLVNGRLYPSGFGSTSGQHMFGVYTGTASSANAQAAAQEFLGAVSWRQQVIVR